MDGVKRRIGAIAEIRPNWVNPVIEAHEFKTSVITSRNGTEQRDALRQTPRIEVTLRADTMGDLGRRVVADVQRFRDSGFHLPIRWRNLTLQGDHAAGATALTFAEDLPWWIVPGTQLIVETTGAQELVEVSSLTGRTVTLAAAMQVAASSASLVSAAWKTRFPKVNKLVSLVNTHRNSQFDFQVEPGSLPVGAGPSRANYGAHEGYPVFIAKPDWGTSPSLESDDEGSMVDFGKGLRSFTFHRDSITLHYSARYRGMSQAEVDELLGLVYHLRGSQGFVWFPSRMEDHRLVTSASQGENALVIAGDELRTTYNQDRTLTTIAAIWPDGCTQFNRIETVGASGDDTYLGFVDQWTRPVDETVTLSWGMLGRLLTDRAEVTWLTSEHADITLTFKAQENDWVPAFYTPEPRLVADVTNFGSPWDDPVAYPYTEFDIGSMGVPLSALDRALVTCGGFVEGLVDTNGSLTYITRIGAWFFDANGVEILPYGDEVQTVSLEETRPEGETQYTRADLGPLTVPPGTRFVRFRGGIIHSTEWENSGCWVSYPQWGQLYDMENLKCL